MCACACVTCDASTVYDIFADMLHSDNLAEVKKRKLLLAIEGSNFSESQDDTNSTEDSQDTAVCICV